MNNPLPPEILKLNVSERIQLVEDIWDSILVITEEIDLTAAQKNELDSRLDRLQQNPNSGSTWEEVKQRIQNGNSVISLP
ncbi:MAG: addiction module protein [Cyanobacteria bacterium P01_F01_bin.143]